MEPYVLYNKSCYSLPEIKPDSTEALITDPPYGIMYQNNQWDKSLPDKRIWADAFRSLKPGAFGAVFSSVKLMHHLMIELEECGFLIKDVMFWSYLNGMPKSRNVALDIDKELGIESKKMKAYKYVQGYKKGGAETYTLSKEIKYKKEPASELAKKFKGSGLGLKPAYEPIILIQKPIDPKYSVAQNMIHYGTGALNLENARIPYQKGESKVGHNPHPYGRVASNIIRTEPFDDGFDKFFLVPKVRQHAENFNHHPTLKPVQLMAHLVKLLTWEGQMIIDPFMGSGSTGVAAVSLKRNFTGYEINKEYFEIARRRLEKIQHD